MDKNLLEATLSLKSAIAEDPRFQKLDELEAKIIADPALIPLIKEKESAENEYNSLLNYLDRNAPEVKVAEQRFHKAKLALDSAPLVEEYNKQYRLVKGLIMEINDVIFSPFQKKILQIGAEQW